MHAPRYRNLGFLLTAKKKRPGRIPSGNRPSRSTRGSAPRHGRVAIQLVFRRIHTRRMDYSSWKRGATSGKACRSVIAVITQLGIAFLDNLVHATKVVFWHRARPILSRLRQRWGWTAPT